ncbi:MAG: hypothetical protein JJU11_17705, partial [Candidatus Sumerlaeia bacterium]|nr:hypothetical protein [Candidatus Sumerlaeia bacterium]
MYQSLNATHRAKDGIVPTNHPRKKVSMKIPRLILLPFLLLGVLVSSLAAIPPQWSSTDYPSRAPSHWYGVEVARFPSCTLAEGVRESLTNRGWGPISLVRDEEGKCRVILGEVARIGDAWYIQKELAVQNVAEGRIVEIPIDTSGRAPKGFSATALLSPFEVTFPDSFDEARLRRSLQALRLTMEADDPDPTPTATPIPTPTPGDDEAPTDDANGDGDINGSEEEPHHDEEDASEPEESPESASILADNEALQAFVELWGAGKTSETAVGRGAMIAARHFWETMVEPEAALFLSSRVASGIWPAPPEAIEEARVMTADLLYGHRRDWRAAWGTTRFLEGERTRPTEKRVMDRLRMAALMAELHAEGREPAPTPQRVRQHLRRSREMLTESRPEIEKRIDYFYLQTFAWEGAWGRVETLARA